MTLIDEVYAHARVLAPQISGENQGILEAVCRSAAVSLKARLRDQLEMITAGDLTLRRGSGTAAAECLRTQAELLMMPYVKDPFVFVGV